MTIIEKFIGRDNFPNLSVKEKSEIRHLISSYKTFMNILLNNKFLNLMILGFIFLFLLILPMNLINIYFPQEDLDPYAFFLTLTLIYALGAFLTIVFYLNIELSFNSFKWLKEYIRLLCKSYFHYYLLISGAFIGIFSITFITSFTDPAFNPIRDMNIIIYALIIYFIMLFIVLILPLYAEVFKCRKEFFMYAKAHLQNYSSYRNKIKAYNNVWTIYWIYCKEFDAFFDNRSVLTTKSTNLILLAEEILKLDNQNENFNRIKNEIIAILSELEEINPLDSSHKYIDIMNKITQKFGNEDFLKRYSVNLKKNILHRLKSKIYILFVLLSIILGLIRFLTI